MQLEQSQLIIHIVGIGFCRSADTAGHRTTVNCVELCILKIKSHVQKNMTVCTKNKKTSTRHGLTSTKNLAHRKFFLRYDMKPV